MYFFILGRTEGVVMSTANDLLSRALEAYDHKEEPYFERLHHAFEDIRAFLEAEPEADKPVAWMRTTPNGDQIVAFHKTDGFEPLYTRPSPARKPMTEEEIEETCDTREFDQIQGGMREAFYFGVRWAEKHHNIGGDE